MRKFIRQLLRRVEGVQAIVVTDRDGVPILKAATENVPELALRPIFLATFGMATEQASKMGLSKNKTIICIYSSYQVVHFNKLPLVISVIANSDANTGLVLGLEDELDGIVEDLREAFMET
jgi:mitogen-activated protein kinase kinase 1 interacting protein 1